LSEKEQIRAYWIRQWGEFDPHVEPLAITEGDGGKVSVRVHQLVKSLQVIEIRSLAPCDDATAFRALNEEWITRYFTLEAKDRETLNNPAHSILLKGGARRSLNCALTATGRIAH